MSIVYLELKSLRDPSFLCYVEDLVTSFRLRWFCIICMTANLEWQALHAMPSSMKSNFEHQLLLKNMINALIVFLHNSSVNKELWMANQICYEAHNAVLNVACCMAEKLILIYRRRLNGLLSYIMEMWILDEYLFLEYPMLKKMLL